MVLGFIGTGKVAWQLSQAFHSSGHTIQFIYGRNISSAKQLAKKFDANASTDLNDLPKLDCLIIAITDSNIQEVSNQIPKTFKGIICHTSGAMNMQVLPSWSNKKGILYPLYSFPSKRKRNLSKVPFLVTSESNTVIHALEEIARSVSERIYKVSDKDRAQLHIAAVMANNFSNFMMTKAFALLKEHGIQQEILLPIIEQSSKNWMQGIASENQTGPAVRRDVNTIIKHLSLLDNPSDKKLYKLVTEQIQKHHS